jgi:hypothetical protein
VLVVYLHVLFEKAAEIFGDTFHMLAWLTQSSTPWARDETKRALLRLTSNALPSGLTFSAPDVGLLLRKNVDRYAGIIYACDVSA